jgi:hypothetical protein
MPSSALPPVTAYLKVEKRCCDAQVQCKPEGGKQEQKGKRDQRIFHGRLPCVTALASRLPALCY